MEFKDINLKFAIIACLNEAGFYKEEAEEIKNNVWDSEEFEELGYDDIVPEVYEYYENLEIDPGRLTSFVEFNPYGVEECYHLMVKEWSGEDDIFDITSLDGIEQLPALKIFKPRGMLDQYEADISALLKCDQLEVVYTLYIPKTDDTARVLEALREKGVLVNDSEEY